MFLRILFSFSLIFVSFFANATELLPWFDTSFQIEARGSYVFQTYPSLAGSRHCKHYSSDDSFLIISAAVSALEMLSLELELTASETRKHDFGFDNFRLTARYLWLDDIVEDPISLMTGLTVTQAVHRSVNDPSSFHHGKIAAELHASIGKEIICYNTWTSRWWGTFGIGIADTGWPWIRGDFAAEHRLCDNQWIRLFINTLWGLGHKHIPCPHSFHGYGPVRHQSIDLGTRYDYRFDIWGTLSLEYSYRVYARNFPANANRLMISYLYPFGI